PHQNGHPPDGIDPGHYRVARLDRADPFRGPGIEHVAGIEGVEGRAPFDQLAAVVDQLLRIAVLLDLPVDRDAERYAVRVGDLVGGDQPWPEHGISIDRFTKAAVLGT